MCVYYVIWFTFSQRKCDIPPRDPTTCSGIHVYFSLLFLVTKRHAFDICSFDLKLIHSRKLRFLHMPVRLAGIRSHFTIKFNTYDVFLSVRAQERKRIVAADRGITRTKTKIENLDIAGWALKSVNWSLSFYEIFSPYLVLSLNGICSLCKIHLDMYLTQNSLRAVMRQWI